MASWKHDVCKLRSYYSFSTLFLWAVAVWVYDEFINSNWQFAVTNNRLTFVSFHIVFLSFCRSWENVTPAPAYKILLRLRRWKNRRSSGRTPAHSTTQNLPSVQTPPTVFHAPHLIWLCNKVVTLEHSFVIKWTKSPTDFLWWIFIKSSRIFTIKYVVITIVLRRRFRSGAGCIKKYSKS
jgi:hypothetical protein